METFNIEEIVNFALVISCHQRDSIVSFAQLHPAILLKYPYTWKHYDKNGESMMKLLDKNNMLSHDDTLLYLQMDKRVDELYERLQEQIDAETKEYDLRIKITRGCCEYLLGCSMNLEPESELEPEPSHLMRYYKNIQTEEGFARPLMPHEAAMLISLEAIPNQRDIDFIYTLREENIITITDLIG